MTDPITSNDSSAPVTEEQLTSFSWWLCMLPFVAIGFVFVFLWWQHRADANATLNLIYGLGTLILGVVFTAMVTGGADNKTPDK